MWSFEMIWGLLRHVLTFGGGFLVTNGWLTESDLETWVGALATVIGTLWSVWQKRKALPPA